ncbi:beta-1,3-galactosyltransferase 5-like [Ptychodera flava]|uniref:beta-1,3-galactosyltransferase 5-like n=1 Tax=Ptychodera flava TaxID=63121 RepID=UPI00396AAB5F
MKLEKIILIVAVVYIVNIVFYVSYYFTSAKNSSSAASTFYFGKNSRWFFSSTDDERQVTYNNTNNLTGQRVNLGVYDYIINQLNKCSGSDVFVLGLVTTAHKHVKERKAIRDTWASVKQTGSKRIVTVFLVAKSDDSRMQRLIKDESVKYKDIVQFNFDEHYLNLTLKTLLGFKWAIDHCPNASYVLKTDDDVFINYYSLAKNLTQMPRTNLAYGYSYLNITPSRNHTDKWYTPLEMYKHDKYPPYLVGTGYVLSNDVMKSVHSVSSTLKFITWEDVFVGIALDKLGIKLRHDWRFDTFSQHTRLKEACSFHPLFTSHHKNPLRLRYMWKIYMKQIAECEKAAAEEEEKKQKAQEVRLSIT